MTDNSFDVNLGIAEVVKEVKDTKTVAEVDTTSALLVRAIHAALSPLEKCVMQKEYNLAATKKLLEAKLQETPVENIITLSLARSSLMEKPEQWFLVTTFSMVMASVRF